jgi:hypothetical protein
MKMKPSDNSTENGQVREQITDYTVFYGASTACGLAIAALSAQNLS